MKYQFTIDTTAADIWQLSMYGIYSSILGAANAVFTVAMILVAVRFFPGAHIVLKSLMLIAVCIFPVIQPLLIYMRAVKQAKSMPKGINLGFDDQGMHVSVENQKEDIAWSTIRGISKKPTLLVIFSSTRHGYVLNNKVLGEQREDFYTYVRSKVNLPNDRKK